VPSRFVDEIPERLIERIRPKKQSWAHSPAFPTRKNKPLNQNETGLNIGQQVSHIKFGTGMITDTEGSGSHARVQVNFDDSGSKWLVVAYAKLTPC